MIDQKQFSQRATFINLFFYKDLLADINSTNANKRFFSLELKCQRETNVLRPKRGQTKHFGADRLSHLLSLLNILLGGRK